ncbi:sensor histidine kinase [Kineococcus esterisolvens]|uniref:sensor histidine kinase n=1 Tax=unclassified Kineococcus TaxID=2621656 RepID=UPI003D7EA1BC
MTADTRSGDGVAAADGGAEGAAAGDPPPPETERSLRDLLAALPLGVLVVGADGVRTVNDAAERAFGPRVGEPFAGVFPRSSPGAPPFAVRRADESGSEPVEVAGRAADGTVFPVEVIVSPGPGPGTALVLARDLRGAARAEAELRRQRSLTALLLESTTDGFLGTDREGRVLFANTAVRRLLRQRAADLVGRPLAEVGRRPADAGDGAAPEGPSLADVAARAAAGGGASSRVVLWCRGTPRSAQVTVAPVVAGEETVGSVLTVRDVTEEERVEELKRQFTAVVSHELRTPLTAIKASLRLVTSGVLGPLPEEPARLLRIADENADRLAALVNDILDVERLDAGTVPLEPEPTDLADLARAGVEQLGSAADAAGVELVLAAAEPAVVHADPHRIAQALTNLVGNAVKFSAAGGRVEVSCTRGAHEARLAVRDEGRGIPHDQLEAVFDRFRQVYASDAQRQSGSGLGLAITKGIVERSGGRVELRSRLNEGSEFTIVLPLADTREEAPDTTR